MSPTDDACGYFYELGQCACDSVVLQEKTRGN